MATAASNQSISAEATVYSMADPGCSDFTVGVRSTSAVGVLVNVTGLHAQEEWFHIPVGVSLTFRIPGRGITQVKLKGDGGTATVDYGVTSF